MLLRFLYRRSIKTTLSLFVALTYCCILPHLSLALSISEKDLADAEFNYKLLQYSSAYNSFKKAFKDSPDLTKDRELVLKFAMSAFRSNHYKDAITYFEIAKSNSNKYNDIIDYYLGRSYNFNKEVDKSINLLSSIPSKYPNSKLINESIVITAKVHFYNDDPAKSNTTLKLLDSSNNLGRYRNDILFMKGNNYINLGDISSGLEKYYELMEKYPSSSNAKDAVKKMIQIRKSESKYLDDKETYLAIIVYRARNDKPNAIKYLDRYFQRYRNGKYINLVHYERGRNRYSQRRYREAIKDFEISAKTLTNTRKIRESKLYIARSKMRSGDRTGAILEYNNFAKFYPTDSKASESLWLIGQTYERMGNTAKAITSYKRAGEDARNRTYRNRALFRVGFLYYKTKQYTKSAEFLNSVQKKYPGTEISRQAAFWEAKAYNKLKKTTSATNVLTTLASYNVRSYYVIRARQILKIDKLDLVNINNIPQVGKLPNDLAEAMESSRIFGSPWGTTELGSLRRKYRTSIENASYLYKFYEEEDVYREAIVTADFIYNKFNYGKYDETTMKMLYPRYFTELIDDVPRAERLGKNLIYSIIRRESLFEFDAISSAGAIGLMQLMPRTARLLAKNAKVRNLKTSTVYLPYNNLRLGITNAYELMQRFKKKLPLVLAAYNSGDGVVRRWMKKYGTSDLDEFVENIEYEETKIFVKEVSKNFYFYSKLYPGAGN